MGQVDKEIGLRLRVARKAAGFKTAQHFADSMPIPKSTYSQHENGKRGLTAEQILHYAKKLDIEPSWLLTGLGHPCPHGQDKVRRKNAIEKKITEYQQLNELPVLKNRPITTEDNAVVVNMALLGKIMISTMRALLPKGVSINTEELMAFYVEVYNHIEFLLADPEEKEKMVELSIRSLLRGNRISLK